MKHLYVLLACVVLLFPAILHAGPLDDFAKRFCTSDPKVSWYDVLDQDVMGNGIHMVVDVTRKVNQDLEKHYGECKGYKIDKKRDKSVITFIYGNDVTMPVEVWHTKNGITSLWFPSSFGTVKNDSFKKIERDLKKLDGKVSVSVRDEKGRDIFSFNADEPLALGSAFKLFVLRALKDKIKGGEIKWDDVVGLGEKDWSHPSGIIVDWVPGTPITVATLATLMISISDNTATDMLIKLLGRETVEKYAPHSRPFITTREMFMLKAHSPLSLAKRYIKGDDREKRQILDSFRDKEMPELKGDLSEPRFIDSIEWFATTRELCDLIWGLRDEKILSVNPAYADDKKKWIRVGYKGGSEPGVIQYTYVFLKKGGGGYSLSATWNDKDKLVDEEFFADFVGRIAEIL